MRVQKHTKKADIPVYSLLYKNIALVFISLLLQLIYSSQNSTSTWACVTITESTWALIANAVAVGNRNTIEREEET
jgi:hypothetical protein